MTLTKTEQQHIKHQARLAARDGIYAAYYDSNIAPESNYDITIFTASYKASYDSYLENCRSIFKSSAKLMFIDAENAAYHAARKMINKLHQQ